MDAVAGVDGHPPGMGIVVLFRVDGLVKASCLGVERKGLPPHKAERRAQDKKPDGKIARQLHKPGGRPCEALVGKLLKNFHDYHLGSIISDLFNYVNNNLIFIIKLLSF